MRRTLLLLAGVAVLTLPAAATARVPGQSAPGYLVVRDASTDGGVTGKPVATLVVRGFVIGRIAQEGSVQLYQLKGSSVGQAEGADVAQRVFYRGAPGTEFSGSGFRFRAVGGVWRVVVHGAGVSLYAGGDEGIVHLHGALHGNDGSYSFDGARFVSLPPGVVTRRLGGR